VGNAAAYAQQRPPHLFLDPGGPSATRHKGDEACKDEEKTLGQTAPKRMGKQRVKLVIAINPGSWQVTVSSEPALSQEPRDKNNQHILFFLVKKKYRMMTSRVGVPWVETDISDVVSVQQPAQEPFQAQPVS